AEREVVKGYAFGRDTVWQHELEASFAYQETGDQQRALAEVKEDMEQPRPMDRLICGDVGYGKTEVALRAAFKAVMDSKQVAVLVPTTVLAQQHYYTFKRRLQAYPVRVEMLSRFRSRAEARQVVEDLSEGKVDIVIGTHRLLSDDVEFRDLGLLIIDEEQRFGVGHKEQLKDMRREVDVLTLTATPIPRTLHLALGGARDMSIIDTPPEDRLPIRTYVAPWERRLVRRAILRELDRNGQIYYVHNRVHDIYRVAAMLRELVPEAKILIGHGQMPEEDLARVMLSFAHGESDLLLCTTIIESGLDIPNVNTIIIDQAERFGLSQLYQLRGRVGRGVERAYAYLLHTPGKPLSDVASARLRTIQEASTLGAGFQVAMRDMEIRGVGDILGAEQHGHIAAVGFDLYSRLLREAVQAMRDGGDGDRAARNARAKVAVNTLLQDLGPAVDLPLSAYLPEDYVEDNGLRLRLYRRMAELRELDGIVELERELQDRFGSLPEPVANLIMVLRVRALCRAAGIQGVGVEQDRLALSCHEPLSPTEVRAVDDLALPARARGGRIWLNMTRDWRRNLVRILECLAQRRSRTSD
ncbi:MAG: DEAD/DEAH box helicase, partial [Anaerolineae bacterium]|nr:DEAD/DEAH box helicase [Anaerolineae bacterium]